MAEGSERAYRWVLLLLVGIFCGGLGGSVFTWYVNRPRPTVLSYRIATTTLSDPGGSRLIPNLWVQIGGSTIQELYAHSIELLPRQGPFVDQAEVAFNFAVPSANVWNSRRNPLVLHDLDCAGLTVRAGLQVP